MQQQMTSLTTSPMLSTWSSSASSQGGVKQSCSEEGMRDVSSIKPTEKFYKEQIWNQFSRSNNILRPWQAKNIPETDLQEKHEKMKIKTSYFYWIDGRAMISINRIKMPSRSKTVQNRRTHLRIACRNGLWDNWRWRLHQWWRRQYRCWWWYSNGCHSWNIWIFAWRLNALCRK